MDPFTFGIVFTGATGAALTGIALLGKTSLAINEDVLKITVEIIKLGAILYLFKYVAFLFL